MRTTILTEKWIPYQTNCNWLRTARRSYRPPARVSSQTPADTEVRRQSDAAAATLADSRTFIPSDYPYV